MALLQAKPTASLATKEASNTIEVTRIYNPLVSQSLSPGSVRQINRIDETKVTCAKCNRIPLIGVSACECISCQKLFCETCLKEWFDLQGNTGCMVCKQSRLPAYTKILSQKNKEALLDCHVYCKNDDCDQVQKLDQSLIDHEKECQLTFHCVNCNAFFPLQTKDDHVYKHIQNDQILGRFQETKQQQPELQQKQTTLRNNITQQPITEENKESPFQSENPYEDDEQLLGEDNQRNSDFIEAPIVEGSSNIYNVIFEEHRALKDKTLTQIQDIDQRVAQMRKKIDSDTAWTNFYKLLIFLMLAFMTFQCVKTYYKQNHNTSTNFQ